MDDFDPTVTNSPKFRLIAVQCVSPPSASPTPRPVPLRRAPSEEKEAPSDRRVVTPAVQPLRFLNVAIDGPA